MLMDEWVMLMLMQMQVQSASLTLGCYILVSQQRKESKEPLEDIPSYPKGKLGTDISPRSGMKILNPLFTFMFALKFNIHDHRM